MRIIMIVKVASMLAMNVTNYLTNKSIHSLNYSVSDEVNFSTVVVNVFRGYSFCKLAEYYRLTISVTVIVQ